MYYVYLLLSERGEKYIGYTKDLKRRLREHERGEVRWTRGRKWELVYFEGYREEFLARKRERKLKSQWRLRAALYRRAGLK